ncbi:hypothetical protein FRC19_005563 [Serendipita sp. 401]|nr:hypothetical protein FRC19_005563 [Serendipita sp. 401]KAG9054628.1 hypothetical protein FS842_004589 [Serendipita sp. 407]
MRSLLSSIAGALFLSHSLSLVSAAPTAAAPPPPALVRRASWTPAQGGCWSDNTGGQRALDRNLGGFDDLTPAKCQSLCEAQGFNLAGVEYGRECFCGNTVFGNNRPTSASVCSMACSGDAAQQCGGPDGIYIYVKDSYPFTVGPASLVSSYNGFQNPQCWHDSANSRILSSHPSTDIPADQMTVQKCIDGCAAAGFSSAGLEFGRECFCGNASNPLADSAPVEECNMPCLGDASEFCGGSNRLLLYHNPANNPVQPTPSGSWAPAQGGCWTDSVQDRALQKRLGSYDDLTVPKCQYLCEQAGFNLAGVEFGRECFCGNTIMGNNHPQAGICTMACTGGSGTCGGPDAINIYVKDAYPYTTGPASVLDSYKGYSKTQCWQDSSSNRLLKQGPATPISYDSMTVQKCIDGCAAAGFSSAGVEYGGECYCDNVTYPPGQSESISECNMACTGDGSKFCGGPNRILIYYKPATPPTVTYTGVIQVLDATTNVIKGYLNKDTQNGISKYSLDPANRAQYSFSAPSGQTVTQAEITAIDKIEGFSLLGLIEGYANANSFIGPGTWQYLFVGGVSHSAPGATPQTGANSYYITPREYESSVWTINSATGDITPQWVNPNGSKPTTYLMGWYGYIGFGSGDPAQTNAHFGHNDGNIKFKFIPNP